MQSARSSSDTTPVQHTVPDIMLTINQLTARVQEQDQLLQGFQLHFSRLWQSVGDLQHHSLYFEYLHHRRALYSHQEQIALCAQNYGILPLYRGPSEVYSQQQHPVPERASVVAQQQHYHITAPAVNAVDEAHVSSIPGPPPPTPAPQQIEYCYAPRILNSAQVEQGKYNKEVVYYQENNVVVQAQPTAPAPHNAIATEPTLNEILEITPEMAAQWGFTWGVASQENYRQN
jgi:hypothetical protein